MPNLRVVALGNNQISNPDIRLFNDLSIGIFEFNISQNGIKKWDLTNSFIENYNFCFLDVSNKQFQITDESDLYLNTSSTYNSGDVHVLGALIDPIRTIVPKQPELYKVFDKVLPSGRYFFSNENIMECDCVIGYFAQMTQNGFERLIAENTTTCGGQEGLKDFEVLDVYNNRTVLDYFACKYTTDDLCPKFCKCIERSSYKHMLIDCRNMQKQVLPKYLPESHSGYNLYVLRMDNNNIKTLPFQEYFQKLESLDMSNNGVTYLSEAIINHLKTMTFLNLSGHSLVELPKRIQLIKIEKIYFGHNPVPCTCENLWIGEWRRRWNAGPNNPLYCQLDDGEVILSDYVTTSYLNCVSHFSQTLVIVSISIMILLILICIFLYYFRYELIILMRKIRSHNKIDVVFEWDCYVSFDGEDPGLREFIINELQPKLSKAGLKIFVPCIDLPFGSVIENEMKIAMSVSKCFLFVLTKDFRKNNLTEYNIARELYTQHPSRIIIILNFDHMPISSFKLPRLQSIKRFSHYIEAVDRQRNIYTEITRILGKP